MTHLSEEEARGKWCPFARTIKEGAQHSTSYNRVVSYALRQYLVTDKREDSEPDGEEFDITAMLSGIDHCPMSARCIASDCMAWRWHGEEYVPGSDGSSRVGYCGLAGKAGKP